jgi:quercetin dioxygenase-like cupin family protein
VLEFFAPPPSTGTSGAYARTRPYVEQPAYTQDQWLGRLPMESAAAAAGRSMRVLRDADLHWRLEGRAQTALVGLYCATEHLTVGRLRLLPGQRSDIVVRGGDEGLYLLSGQLNILAPEAEGQRWFELHPQDGFYLPQGAPRQYQNLTAEPVELLFGVAPRYLPGD